MTTTENPGSPPLTDPVERKAIHAYLTERSHANIHNFCGEHGVSVSGLLEALGEQLDLVSRDQVNHLDPQALVKRSRKIDAERRRRGR